MTESLLRPPTARTAGGLADWVEATLAVENRDLLSKASIRKRLAADGNDDEASLSLLYTELRRRRSLGGPLYPYKVGGAGVQREEVANSSYDFLLVCSLEEATFRRTRDWSSSVRLFEQLTVAGLSALFGAGTHVLRFGYPPDAPRPERFPDAVDFLARKLNLQRGPGRAATQEQDGGVDAIAWRPFADKQVGFPVLLAQCTLQLQYESKGADVVLARWRNWVTFRRDPLTALVVPFDLGRTNEAWEDVHYTVDVIVDRFRLCALLAEVDLAHWPHRGHLEGWLNHELRGLGLAG